MLGVAVVISGVVTRLGQQVTKAREMGSYRLGELIGRGGMGEVYLAHHRMLARPAAIKLIRAGGPRRRRRQPGAGRRGALPPRGRGRGQAQVAAHGPAVRLRRDRGRPALPRDGAARGHQPRPARPAGRPAAGLARGAHSPPGLRVAGGGPRRGAGAPGHQARQHPPGARRAAGGFREAARLRPGEVGGRRAGRFTGQHGGDGGRDAGLHGARDGAWRRASTAGPISTALGCVAYYLLTGHYVFSGETPIQTVLLHVQQEPVPPSQRTDNLHPAGPGAARAHLPRASGPTPGRRARAR